LVGVIRKRTQSHISKTLQQQTEEKGNIPEEKKQSEIGGERTWVSQRLQDASIWGSAKKKGRKVGNFLGGRPMVYITKNAHLLQNRGVLKKAAVVYELGGKLRR